MTNQATPQSFLAPLLLGTWVAGRSDIWQMGFMGPNELATFGQGYGLSLGTEDVEKIWQLGLLRAELIVSERELRNAGLIAIKGDDDDRYYYVDARKGCRVPKNWSEGFRRLRPRTSGLEIWFHPFRYYVLHCVYRWLELNISPVYTLLQPRWYREVVDSHVLILRDRLRSQEFLKGMERVNDITALVVATEPCVYPRLFGTLRSKGSVDFNTQMKRIDAHWQEVAGCFQKLSLEQVEEARRDLCIAAVMLEPNVDLHGMLRLAKGDIRSKLTGHLGGAMCLRTMAEILRRASEEVWSKKLPEEDEIGLKASSPEGKERFYGSTRLFDRDRNVAQELMISFGLDFSLRVRWYVEGHTEFGALRWLFKKSNLQGVEIINLKGKVIESAGKGVAFVESLREDIDQCVMSFISIDGDVSLNMKAVRMAAEREDMFGMFFNSTPDFELHNFTYSELEEILWDFAIENGANPSHRVKLRGAIQSWQKEMRSRLNKDLRTNQRRDTKRDSKERNGFNDFLAAVKPALPELAELSKGEPWGERLMKYAWRNQIRSDGEKRPVIEAVNACRRAVRLSYQGLRGRYRTDPITGTQVIRIKSPQR